MTKVHRPESLSAIGISVADNISAMLAYWDKNLVCRFANAAYLNWFGRTSEEMIDKIALQELLGPAVYEKNLPYIHGALNGVPQTFERELPLPTGGVRQTLANYFPDVVEGEVKGFFVHVADITPVKTLENELIRTNEIVNEQNNRLLNFANIVSHNLKSYAGNMNAVLDILANPASQEEQQEMLGYLRTIARNFGETVNNLNEIAKAQNQIKLKPEEINLFDYVNKSIEILRLQVVSMHANILNHVNPNLIIFANPAYVESILLNLLTNAIKYSHPERPPVIEINATIVEKELRLTIKDNGLGIDMAKHGKRLFGLYQTFHENANAHGVGLYIVKFQVESMGGRIEVESEVGKGTTFSIYFKL